MYNVGDKVQLSKIGQVELDAGNSRFINIKSPGTVTSEIKNNKDVTHVLWLNGLSSNYMNNEIELLYSKTDEHVRDLFYSLDKIEKKINKSNK